MKAKIPDGTKQQIKRNIISARTWLNEIIDIADGFNVTFHESEFVETKAGLEELKSFCQVYYSLLIYLQKSANDITTHPFTILQTFENLIASLTSADEKFTKVLKHFDKISIFEISAKLKPPLTQLTSTLKRLILGVTEVCISNVDPNGNVVTASIKLRDYLLDFCSDLRMIFVSLKPIKLYNEKSMKLSKFLDTLLDDFPNEGDKCKSLLVQQFKFRENIDVCKSEKIHQTLIDMFSVVFSANVGNNTPARRQLYNTTVGNLTRWKTLEVESIQEITLLLVNAIELQASSEPIKSEILKNSKMFSALLLSTDIRFTYTLLTDKLQSELKKATITVECATNFYPTRELTKIYEDSIFQFSKSIRQSTSLTATLNQIIVDILRLQKTVVNLKKDIIERIKSDPFIPQNVHNPLGSINFDVDVLSMKSSENNFL